MTLKFWNDLATTIPTFNISISLDLKNGFIGLVG